MMPFDMMLNVTKTFVAYMTPQTSMQVVMDMLLKLYSVTLSRLSRSVLHVKLLSLSGSKVCRFSVGTY
jgi:hypothetical protein